MDQPQNGAFLVVIYSFHVQLCSYFCLEMIYFGRFLLPTCIMTIVVYVYTC